MCRVVFFSGQSQAVADIVRSSMPEGFSLDVFSSKGSAAEKSAQLAEAEFLILHPAELDHSLLQNAKKLRHIQLLTAGYDKLDLAAAKEFGISVSTNGGANAWAVAEQTIALLLCLYKRLIPCDASVRAGNWRKPINGMNTFELAGKTVGLLGFGNIGSKVAQRLLAFETKVIYHDEWAKPNSAIAAQSVDFQTLLTESDVLSVHVPLTPETRGKIDASALLMMKPSAVIVNTSRAEVFDEAALEKALATGRIAGAGLDVFHREPPAADCGLFALENVVLSPHSAGHSYEGWFRRSSFAWENIERVVAGLSPLSVAR